MVLNFEGVENGRQVAARKRHIDNGTNDLEEANGRSRKAKGDHGTRITAPRRNKQGRSGGEASQQRASSVKTSMSIVQAPTTKTAWLQLREKHPFHPRKRYTPSQRPRKASPHCRSKWPYLRNVSRSRGRARSGRVLLGGRGHRRANGHRRGRRERRDAARGRCGRADGGAGAARERLAQQRARAGGVDRGSQHRGGRAGAGGAGRRVADGTPRRELCRGGIDCSRIAGIGVRAMGAGRCGAQGCTAI